MTTRECHFHMTAHQTRDETNDTRDVRDEHCNQNIETRD